MSSIKSDQKVLNGFQEIERTTLEERVAQLQNALARTTDDGVTSPRNIRVRVPDDVASIVTSLVGSSSNSDCEVVVEDQVVIEER